MAEAKIRLYVEHPLGPGQTVPLTEAQAHYLFGVMRLSPGGDVLLFNGRDGEWRAEVTEKARRKGQLRCIALTRAQDMPPDLWLLFAPVKKARTDFIVEKAVELGVRRIVPVQTDFTNSERVRQDRLQGLAVEAAEQCGATFVPEVGGLQKLSGFLGEWDPKRTLWFADEAAARSAQADFADLASDGDGRAGILIGPEGGFSEAERNRLMALPFVRRLALGPRVLRAETAAVAALVLWQHRVGDWR